MYLICAEHRLRSLRQFGWSNKVLDIGLVIYRFGKTTDNMACCTRGDIDTRLILLEASQLLQIVWQVLQSARRSVP